MPGGQAHSQNPQQPCPQGCGLDDKGYGNDKMFSSPKAIQAFSFLFPLHGLEDHIPLYHSKMSG